MQIMQMMLLLHAADNDDDDDDEDAAADDEDDDKPSPRVRGHMSTCHTPPVSLIDFTTLPSMYSNVFQCIPMYSNVFQCIPMYHFPMYFYDPTIQLNAHCTKFSPYIGCCTAVLQSIVG